VSAARRTGSQGETALLAVAGAAVAVAFGWGLGVRLNGDTMGTALSPFVMAWLPRADPWALAAVPVFVACAALAPRLLALPSRAFIPGVLVLAAVAGLALNAIPLGPHGWYVVHDLGPTGSFEAKNEYLPGLSALAYGDGFFLDRFAELIPSLPINVAGHPPGLVLSMHWLGIDTARLMGALCVAATALCAPLSYALGRAAGLAEDRARIAAVLVALSPGFLLFGISAVDSVFAAMGTAAAALLISRRTRWIGAVALAVFAFYAWSLLAIGFLAAVVVWRREGLRSAVVLAAGFGAAVLAFNGAVWAVAGYDPVGTLAATQDYYDRSLARIRPYWFWWLGSPVAWAVSMGPPIAAAWLIAARRGDAIAVSLAAVVAIAAGLGFTKAETERIWLFLVPIACVAAATVIPRERLALVVGLLAAQGLAVSFLFQTLW
jgi:methylthioxylose transferase